MVTEPASSFQPAGAPEVDRFTVPADPAVTAVLIVEVPWAFGARVNELVPAAG